MKLNDYSSLLSELRKGERQRVYILTGERGLGKHSVLSAAAETIKETAPDATILSVHPDAFSFSLWPMEEALRQSTPDAALPSHEMKDGLNYPEQLIRSILELCSGKKRTIIFLNRLQSFNDDLWSFTTKLLRLLLDPYRSFNVCFCCCLHTDGVLRSQSGTQTRSADQLIGLFSRYPQSTCYLYFHPWSREGLQRFLENELFQGKLRMAPGQRGLLLDAAMGNPATLINLTERMKARGLLYEENGFYCCGSIDGTVLLTCGPVPATEEYTRMEHPLQELLRGSSVIGVEFEAQLLSDPLGFWAVKDKLRRLLSISRIIQRKVDDLYEFESIFARLSIRDLVSKEESVLWNSRLGEYFWKLSQRQITEGAVSASLNSLKKSAFYYDEAMNRAQAMQLYERLSMELMSIMQYRDAVKVLRRMRDLCELVPDLRTPNDLNRTWQLEGDCYRYCSDFSKAITAYETFLERAKLTKYERMDAQCSYCVVLYESGEISRPLEHLRTLLSELQKETGPQAASILVRTLSCLTSIEETLCDPMHEFHFNAALDIAKRYHLEDEYYVLLRKSLIVHKGVYGISLMESARVYFERIGNQKELARTWCNLAAELLLHGDLEQARSNYQHSAEILRSFGAETIYVPINGLGDYWCLRGNFERALSLFEEAYREEYDAFTRIAIRINQATAHRKLGHYDAAAERLAQAEKISNSGDAAEYAILLPHLLIGKALLLYDRGELEEAYPLFLKYIQEDPSFGRRRLALAGQYIQKICAYFQRPVPDGVDAFAKATSPADERLLRHGITLIRFSITE